MTGTSVEVERYWADCLRSRPDLAACEPHVRGFGRTPQLSRLLLELITNGEKTCTFSLLPELEASGDPLPKRGDCFVVTDFEGKPAAVIRLIAVQSLPYRDVSGAQTQYEGPAARDVAAWRAIHWQYWKKLLASSGREPNEEMIVVFQQFELVHVRPHAGNGPRHHPGVFGVWTYRVRPCYPTWVDDCRITETRCCGSPATRHLPPRTRTIGRAVEIVMAPE